MSRDLTTAEVAKACAVSSRTVHNWMTKGLLTGYRLPAGPSGNGHRRFNRDTVERFMQTTGIPLDGLPKAA